MSKKNTTEPSYDPAVCEATYEIEANTSHPNRSLNETIIVTITVDTMMSFDAQRARAIFQAAYPNLRILSLQFQRVS